MADLRKKIDDLRADAADRDYPAADMQSDLWSVLETFNREVDSEGQYRAYTDRSSLEDGSQFKKEVVEVAMEARDRNVSLDMIRDDLVFHIRDLDPAPTPF